MALDFDTLAPNQLNALEGVYREAWYAHCRGDHERRDDILGAYDDLDDPALPEPVWPGDVADEAPVEAADAPETTDRPQEGDVETATPAKPARRAPAKKAPAKRR